MLNLFGGLCGYCGRRTAIEVDHIQSKFHGGKLVKGNFMPSCRKCNIIKSHYSLENFRKKIYKFKNKYSNYDKLKIAGRMIIYHVLDVYFDFDGQFYFEKNKPTYPIDKELYFNILSGDPNLENCTDKRIMCYNELCNKIKSAEKLSDNI